MNSPRPTPPVPPEALGDPAVIMLHGAQAGRICIEIIRATRQQRRGLEPFLRFLRTLPKPPNPESITITLADPALFGLILTGRLHVGSLELVERIVGLHVLLPDDRWGQSGPVAAWVATFRDRLRARLHTVRRAPGRKPPLAH